MASGAQLNRAGQNGGELLLSILPTAGVVANPGGNYGTVGVNDSGAVFWEGIGFTKTAIQMIGAGANQAGYTVNIYVTIDPAARPNGTPLPKGSILLPTTSWTLAVGQAATAGAAEANPLVSGTNTLFLVSGPYVALRVVLQANATPTNPVAILAFAVP